MKNLVRFGYRALLHLGHRVYHPLVRLYQSFQTWQRHHGRDYVPEAIQIPFYFKCLRQAVPLPNSHVVLGDFPTGFFAIFNEVMGAVYYAKEHQHNLVLDFKDSHHATEGKNWWGHYFEKDTFYFSPTPPKQKTFIYWEKNPLIPWHKSSSRHLHRLIFIGFCLANKNHKHGLASEIFKSLGLKSHIQKKADAFFQKTCAGRHVIGVHYRGTDKVKLRKKSVSGAEAPHLPYGFVFAEIKKSIEHYAKDDFLIFVATDEQDFVTEIEKRFSNRIVCADAFRSPDGNPVHAAAHFHDKKEEKGISVHGQSMVQLGEEVLIDMLVLSKCNVLLRTESAVSLACQVVNPTQPVVNMTKRYRWKRFFYRQ